MFDIGFFRRTFGLKKEIVSRGWGAERDEEIFSILDQERSSNPFVFNVETTNNCNMSCVMCPRTTQMDRRIENMDRDVFSSIAAQVSPHSGEDFAEWVSFVGSELGLRPEDTGENPFYFFISSRAVTLHGFGEPLLDPHITERVQLLTDRGVPTYFSCNPSNINPVRIESLFRAGLTYIKFSVDSLSDENMRRIRGPRADYGGARDRILQVLDLRERENFPATVVLCMILMSGDQEAEASEFLRTWEGRDVYAYIKSQDNQWYFREADARKARSHYESQYCEFPWTSLSVMADGTVVPCTQDFNCEMPMGNIRNETLKEIWNSDRYRKFRMMHIRGDFPPNYRCRGRCDLKTVSDYLNHPPPIGA